MLGTSQCISIPAQFKKIVARCLLSVDIKENYYFLCEAYPFLQLKSFVCHKTNSFTNVNPNIPLMIYGIYDTRSSIYNTFKKIVEIQQPITDIY